MKQCIFFPTLIVIALASCNPKPTQPTETNTITDTSKVIENKVMIPKSTCYASSGKDSVYLKVEVFENVVTGNLSYKIFEKDSNKGDFEGQLRGDTLLADYKFMSEGTQSTRQVIFLLKDDMAIEGYGNMEEKNGKMVFTDTKGVSFGSGIKLTKVPCN